MSGPRVLALGLVLFACESTTPSDPLAIDVDRFPNAHEEVAAWNRWRAENPDHAPALRGLEPGGRDLRGIDLHGTDLRRRSLAGTDLSEADLRHADLRACRFADVVLEGARVEGLDLRGADLRGADLRGVVGLDSADLRGVEVGESTLWPSGFDARRRGADVGGDARTLRARP